MVEPKSKINQGLCISIYIFVDPRELDKRFVARQSINMALSTRGRETLKRIGLEDFVLSHAVPMHGRMIHQKDGSMKPHPYDPTGNEVTDLVSQDF